MFWNIVLVLVLVFANGFFVAAEFALVKLRLQEIKLMALEGGKSAKLVENIVEHLDAYLSACQLGITLASLGLGWVGEPLLANMFEPYLHSLGISEDKVHYVTFPIAFGIITLLHITAGEQVPKILAIKKYKPTSLAIAFPLSIFYRIFKPFIWGLNTISNMMLRLAGIDIDSEHGGAHTEEELRDILLESAAVGHLTRRKRLFMENVLDLENKIARRYMVPRNQIIYIDSNDPVKEQLRIASESSHTRLPLCDDDLDHVTGIVHVKDIFNFLANGKEITSLKEFARKPAFIPETVTLDILLKEFQQKNIAFTLLVDEYGVLSGMITLENVLEELVGQIQDEFDSEQPSIIKKDTGIYEVDATCPVDQVVKHVGIDLPASSADTIGGIIIEQFGYIPAKDDKIIVGNHRATVIDSEPTRVKRILLQKVREDSDIQS